MLKSRSNWNLVPLPALGTRRGRGGGVLRLQDLTRKRDKLFTHLNLHQTNQQVGQFTFWSTLGARTSHGQLWTYLIHHGPDSREAITFPHIVYSAPLHGGHIQMAFCLGTPTWESRNCLETVPVWTLGTLVAHNSLLKPSIGMRSKANLQFSLKAFQWCVALCMHAPGSGRFLTFSGRESNCQFDSRPFFHT